LQLSEGMMDSPRRSHSNGLVVGGRRGSTPGTMSGPAPCRLGSLLNLGDRHGCSKTEPLADCSGRNPPFILNLEPHTIAAVGLRLSGGRRAALGVWRW